MANIADYLPGGEKHKATEGGIDDEINDATQQQEAREKAATPEVDWAKRYEELEKLNSRQAQDLGTYRKLVDEYITNPTPSEPVVAQESKPITVDDLYDNPDEAIQRAVESHPAIREARDIKTQLENQRLERELEQFRTRHPDFESIGGDPAFRNWVEESPTRVDLFQQGNQYNLSAADALFSLYKAEKNITQMNDSVDQAAQIAAAELESSSHQMVDTQPKYSRSEYVDKLMRARQGDLDAETWVKRNAAGYREALTNGNVRD